MKTALALYLQDKSSNSLGGTTNCTTATTITDTATSNQIRISLAAASAGYKSGTDVSARYAYATTSADQFRNDGIGWIPGPTGSTFLASVTGGAPIEKVPVDPVNTGGAGSPGVDSLYYRYACKTNNTFELDATLESDTYKYLGTDDKPSKDGGNSVMRFEVGTDLNILPSSAPISFTL